MKFLLLALLLFLCASCTRHYHLYVIGSGHEIDITVLANVPKQVDASPTLDLDLVP